VYNQQKTKTTPHVVYILFNIQLLQVYLKLLYTLYTQFRAAIADLKIPEKTDSYLLTWLRGKKITVQHTVIVINFFPSPFLSIKQYNSTVLFK